MTDFFPYISPRPFKTDAAMKRSRFLMKQTLKSTAKVINCVSLGIFFSGNENIFIKIHLREIYFYVAMVFHGLHFKFEYSIDISEKH